MLKAKGQSLRIKYHRLKVKRRVVLLPHGANRTCTDLQIENNVLVTKHFNFAR